ncbi:MAG: RNA polymerase sigma factor [Phocaeicola sp.]
MGQLNDIALVAQVVLLKNNRAFDTLICKYQSSIRCFFMNHTVGNEELSDDLAQETFLKAYTHLSTFKSLSSFSTWLYRIAYNTLYDYIRSKKEAMELEIWEVDTLHQTEQKNIGQQMDLYQGLAILKEGERTCITLFYMEDLTIEKIVAITGIPSGTVKSHLSRGKEKLAHFLKSNGYERSKV